MEGQITLNEWLEWKEDIRRKLAETAENFVYIGYRLRQIRDSGMLDGCSDIFEFAQREYGLGKSTVSRFIAINERFSEDGNSLELRREYKAIGSSKLAEMLTLTDAECQLITERTTVREIRELKSFDRKEEITAEVVEQTYTPLQKCIIDYFSDERRKEALNGIMELLAEDCTEHTKQTAAELVNPGEYATHKKGIIFLFMYDYKTGVKYKAMGAPEPVSMSWTEFLAEIISIYECFMSEREGVWNSFYGSKKELAENATPAQENQAFSASVATSQQTEKMEKIEPENTEEIEVKEDGENEQTAEEETEDGEASSGVAGQKVEYMHEPEEIVDNNSESVGGSGTSEADGECQEEPEQGSDGDVEVITPTLEALAKQADITAGDISNYFWDVAIAKAEGIELEKLKELKTKAEEVVTLIEQMIEIKAAEG